MKLATLVDVETPVPIGRKPPEEADELVRLCSGFGEQDRELVLVLARQIARQRATAR